MTAIPPDPVLGAGSGGTAGTVPDGHQRGPVMDALIDYATSPTAIPCGRRIAELRREIAEFRGRLAALEVEMLAALLARGSRPGDGSDQPALFLTDAQSKLF